MFVVTVTTIFACDVFIIVVALAVNTFYLCGGIPGDDSRAHTLGHHSHQAVRALRRAEALLHARSAGGPEFGGALVAPARGAHPGGTTRTRRTRNEP